MSYTPEALEAARKVGLEMVTPEGRTVDRQKTTARLIELLVARGDVTSESQVGDTYTIDSLTTAVFESSEPDLRMLVSNLCALGAGGAVQSHLNGRGSMLCGQRVIHVASVNGETARVGLTHRFLSTDANTVDEFLLKGRGKRFVRSADNHHALLSLAAHRIPALAPRMGGIRLAIVDQVRALLAPVNNSEVAA